MQRGNRQGHLVDGGGVEAGHVDGHAVVAGLDDAGDVGYGAAGGDAGLVLGGGIAQLGVDVVGDGGAEDGDIRSSGVSGLQRGGGVGQDEVHAVGHKAVYYSGAVVLLAAGVLDDDFDLVAEGGLKCVDKAFGSGVKRGVDGQLADADLQDLAVGVAALVSGGLSGLGSGGVGTGGGFGSGVVRSAAGGQRKQHHGCEQKGEDLFHFGFSFSILSGSKKAAPPVWAKLLKAANFQTQQTAYVLTGFESPMP